MNVTWKRISAPQASISPPLFLHLLQRARSHDEEALVALYQRALPIIYRYVIVRVGHPDLAEDVVSEVFLTMVESIGDLRTEEEAGFYAWLLQIAQGKISRAIRHLAHSRKKQVPFPDPSGADSPAPQELMAMDLVSNPAAFHDWQETLEELGGALEKLSDEQQTVIVGRFLAGESIEALAIALGKQPGAVRVLQFRALKTLAKHLGFLRRTNHQKKGAWR